MAIKKPFRWVLASLLAEDIKPLPVSQVTQRGTSPKNTPSIDTSAPIELPTGNLNELRDVLTKNPSLLPKLVTSEPYIEDGEIRGFKITPNQNPEIFEAVGVLPGDIVTSVNNIALNSNKQGVRALRNLVNAEQVGLVVLRNGAEVPINISLAQ